MLVEGGNGVRDRLEPVLRVLALRCERSALWKLHEQKAAMMEIKPWEARIAKINLYGEW